MRLLKRFRVLLVAIGCIVSTASISAQAVIGQERGLEAPHQLKDQPVDDYRLELIDLAWQAATSYPINPHIKNRARAEEAVVLGALGIDQPGLAWKYANKVVNWRRGACYAEIARYLVENNELEPVEYFLHQAVVHSYDGKQGWRQDRVKAIVAGIRAELEAARAPREEDGSQETDAASQEAEQQAFERQIEALDALVKTEGYDQILQALNGYTNLYARYYNNEKRREYCLEKTYETWQPMPGLIRFGIIMRFADVAMEHDDTDTAMEMVAEAESIQKTFTWTVDYDLRLRSDVAKYRIRLGQETVAREILEDALELADAGLEKLTPPSRAGALLPVIEGFAALGDKEVAHELYIRATQLGAVNEGIRPRIVALTANCVSMAVNNIEPDESLRNMIRQSLAGLAD